MENKKMSDMEQKAKLSVLSNLRDTAKKAMGSKLGKKGESMAPALNKHQADMEDGQTPQGLVKEVEEAHPMEECSPEELDEEIAKLQEIKAKKLAEMQEAE